MESGAITVLVKVREKFRAASNDFSHRKNFKNEKNESDFTKNAPEGTIFIRSCLIFFEQQGKAPR